jgi:hypothetical protein
MLSHVVIFWTKPNVPQATERLIEGAREFLPRVPGVIDIHIGKMVPSDRPVVDQSYQVGLYIKLADKAAEVAYQQHPLHVEFVEKVFKVYGERVAVYDFVD